MNRVALPDTAANGGPGARRTRTHGLGEWLVANPRRASKVLGWLAQNPEFDVVGDLDDRLRRKLYMVNGGHLSLGIRGAELRRVSLRATARIPANLYDVSALHVSMAHGLAFAGCRLPDTFTYGRKHVQAYCEVADRVDRIMAKLDRTDIARFLRDVEGRLARPARLTADAQRALDPDGRGNDWLRPYRETFDHLGNLLADPACYPNGRAIRKGEVELDAQRDHEAVQAFEQCLTGWESSELIDERVHRLDEALTIQRIALGQGDPKEMARLRPRPRGR